VAGGSVSCTFDHAPNTCPACVVHTLPMNLSGRNSGNIIERSMATLGPVRAAWVCGHGCGTWTWQLHTDGTAATSLLNADPCSMAILDGELAKSAFVAANAQLRPKRPAFQNFER